MKKDRLEFRTIFSFSNSHYVFNRIFEGYLLNEYHLFFSVNSFFCQAHISKDVNFRKHDITSIPIKTWTFIQ